MNFSMKSDASKAPARRGIALLVALAGAREHDTVRGEPRAEDVPELAKSLGGGGAVEGA